MKSNAVPLQLNVKISGDVNWGTETGELDARKAANALADEFEWLDFGPNQWTPEIEILNLWVERETPVRKAHRYRLCCKFRKNCEYVHHVSFDIRKGAMRLPIYLVCGNADVENDEDDDVSIVRKDVPWELVPGLYDIKCEVIRKLYNRQDYTASSSITLPIQ